MSETETKPAEGQPPLTWGTRAQIMRQLGFIAVALVGWALVLGVVMAPQAGSGVAAPVAGHLLTWEAHIYPIMQRQCVLCHGAAGGIALTSYESALAGGVSGPAIIPGDAANSLFYKLLLGPAEGIPAMPLGQPRLPQDSIDLIGAWIDQLDAP